jgi:hypothetical protein
MNYVILIGLALFFVATALRRRDGLGLQRDSMNFRLDDDNYSLRSRPTARSISSRRQRRHFGGRGGSFDINMRRGFDQRVLFTSPDGTIERQFFVEGEGRPGAPRPTASSPKRCRSCCAKRPSTQAASRVAHRKPWRDPAARRDPSSPFGLRAASTASIRTDCRDRRCDFERLMTMTADHMSSDFGVRTTLIGSSTRRCRREQLRRPPRGRRTIVRLRCAHGARARRTEHAALAGSRDAPSRLGDDLVGFDMRLALQPS